VNGEEDGAGGEAACRSYTASSETPPLSSRGLRPRSFVGEARRGWRLAIGRRRSSLT
jgi:hypothetical protein